MYSAKERQQARELVEGLSIQLLRKPLTNCTQEERQKIAHFILKEEYEGDQ